jgi:hypothetical protein
MATRRTAQPAHEALVEQAAPPTLLTDIVDRHEAEPALTRLPAPRRHHHHHIHLSEEQKHQVRHFHTAHQQVFIGETVRQKAARQAARDAAEADAGAAARAARLAELDRRYALDSHTAMKFVDGPLAALWYDYDDALAADEDLEQFRVADVDEAHAQARLMAYALAEVKCGCGYPLAGCWRRNRAIKGLH